MKPTALHLLARALGGPDTEDAEVLAAWARRPAEWPASVVENRRQAVISYVYRAATGGLAARESGRGSLKHLLWWLRDHAGGLYAPAARAVLGAALDSAWPLATTAESLRAHPLVGGLVHQALMSERAEDLARHLIWEEMPRGRVAWNRTTLNLSKVAFRAGAAWYVAVSTEGGCLMGARGQSIIGFDGGGGWTRPYPNLAVLTRPGALGDETGIRAWLERTP